MSIFDQLGEMPPAAALLGWQFVDFDEEQGLIRVSFEASPQFVSPSGFIQGGFLVAMLDEVMGCAVTAASKAQSFTTSISISIDFLRPASPGRVLAEGRITSMGKSVVFLEGKLFNDAGKVLARATSSCKLIPLDPNWIRPIGG